MKRPVELCRRKKPSDHVDRSNDAPTLRDEPVRAPEAPATSPCPGLLPTLHQPSNLVHGEDRRGSARAVGETDLNVHIADLIEPLAHAHQEESLATSDGAAKVGAIPGGYG